mmetsp:Transcript_123260/g.356100  ORF Transcript_123260/g.356100 Transcript_123260/m.356100 type:complete len:260 (+) Transcript_123260:356-1135(+)
MHHSCGVTSSGQSKLAEMVPAKTMRKQKSPCAKRRGPKPASAEREITRETAQPMMESSNCCDFSTKRSSVMVWNLRSISDIHECKDGKSICQSNALSKDVSWAVSSTLVASTFCMLPNPRRVSDALNSVHHVCQPMLAWLDLFPTPTSMVSTMRMRAAHRSGNADGSNTLPAVARAAQAASSNAATWNHSPLSRPAPFQCMIWDIANNAARRAADSRAGVFPGAPSRGKDRFSRVAQSCNNSVEACASSSRLSTSSSNS